MLDSAHRPHLAVIDLVRSRSQREDGEAGSETLKCKIQSTNCWQTAEERRRSKEDTAFLCEDRMIKHINIEYRK